VTEQERQLQVAVDQIPHGVQPLIESCQRLKDSVVPAMSAAVQEAVEQNLAATMERSRSVLQFSLFFMREEGMDE
jgi:hypothetical protein